MVWIGRLSTFLLAQLLALTLGVGAGLYFSGRMTPQEASFLWDTAVALTEGEPLPTPPGAEPTPETPEAEPSDVFPSFEQLERARLRGDRQLSQQQADLRELDELIARRQEQLVAQQQALRKIREQAEQGLRTAEDQAVTQARQQVVGLLETMQPAQSAAFLQDLTDDTVAIEYLKALDPVIASKVFREFETPEQQRRLNGWLAEMGRGEPARSKADELRNQLLANGP